MDVWIVECSIDDITETLGVFASIADVQRTFPEPDREPRKWERQGGWMPHEKDGDYWTLGMSPKDDFRSFYAQRYTLGEVAGWW